MRESRGGEPRVGLAKLGEEEEEEEAKASGGIQVEGGTLRGCFTCNPFP